MAKRGTTGARGPKGKPGEQGARGPAGAVGARGARGPQGRSTSRAHILAVVDDQFTEMRKQLDFQLKRSGELQREFDLQRKDIAELRQQLGDVHGLRKDLMKTTA